MRHLSPSLPCLLLLALPCTALAEARWLPIVTGDLDEASLGVLQPLGGELQTRANVELLDPEAAGAHFEQRFAVAAPDTPDEALEAAASGIRQALQATGFDHWDEAKKHASTYWELSQPARDLVKLSHDVANDALDYCAMMAVGDMKAGRTHKARSALRACIEESPSLEPRLDGHPIMELWRQERFSLLAQGPATLKVRTTAEIPGCEVAINGRPVGAAPYEAQGLIPGITYRVQLRCASPGRVHVAALKPGPNTLTIDPRFDAAVSSAPYLALRYPSHTERKRFLRQDARRLAKYLSANDVLLIAKADGGPLRLTLASAELGATTTLSPDASGQAVRGAALDLTGGEASETAKQPVVLADPRPEDSTSLGTSLAGAALALGGAVNIALGWRAYDLRAQYRSRLTTDPAYEADYDEATINALILGVSGNALTALAVPLLVPEGSSPAIAWIGGILGLGVGALGAGLLAAGDPCSPTACSAGSTDGMLGTLVLLHSAPLLAVPITYAVRSGASSEDVHASVDFNSGGGTLQLQGRF